MAAADANPLLADTFPIAFDAIGADHVTPAVDALLSDARRRLDDLCQVEAPGTFDTVMVAYQDLAAGLVRAIHIVTHLEGVATHPDLREAYNDARPRAAEFLSGLPLHEPLWTVVKRYAASPEAMSLSGARKRFLDKTVADLRRSGADLDQPGKQRLAEINVALTQRCMRFGQHVLDATNAFELLVAEEKDLAGLPDRARDAARQSAEEAGKQGWRFTLQGPSYMAAVTYLDESRLRERLYRAMATRATHKEHDNRGLVEEVLALRAEKAALLGYGSYADLVTADRMAKSGARAQAFVDDLAARTRDAFHREQEDLLRFRRELEGPGAPTLKPWDVAYYAEKQRRARYELDEEALRPYFPFQRVLAGAFTIAGRLYDVRFEPWEQAPSWHDQVQAYRVIDQADDTWLAGIYVDPHPRTTKRGGAWVHALLTRGQSEPDRRQIGVLVANVAPPLEGEDALLTHGDVVTLFHELGHLMHHCLSRTALRGQSGLQVAWDFVELPSQILENWCWEREALDLFAHHVDTDEPILPELHQAMTRARTHRAATHQMQQLGFATVDLALHTNWDADRDGDPIGYARRLLAPFWPTALPEYHAAMASFDHLFGDPEGYAAAYYSYKWAEVLDADAFTRFRQAGVLDRETGMAFRRAILERGDEEDPEVLYRDFMGRDPELDALLLRLGLASARQKGRSGVARP
ncbi:MAG: M3 family metallopeptidase [Deltaproteobacteria bacterium]|nr:M3 family metallopeptidase [Deltaproteobacteria bacterium]